MNQTAEFVIDEFRKRHRLDPGAVLLADLPIVDGRLLWTCSVCGKEENWNDSWSTWGSIALREIGWVVPVCSDACREGYEIIRKGP